MVTLSIGGNDIQFASILAACVNAFYVGIPGDPYSTDCSTVVLDGDTEGIVDANANRLANVLPGRLTAVLSAIRDRAPNARIALMGYPELFETGTVCVSISLVNQVWLNDMTDGLNNALADAAATASVPGQPDIFFVDPRPSFSGNNLCTGSGSAINGLTLVTTPGENPYLRVGDLGFVANGSYVSQVSVHPNSIGTQLYANALEAALALHP